MPKGSLKLRELLKNSGVTELERFPQNVGRVQRLFY